MKYEIIKLCDKPEIKMEAALWFNSKWGVPKEAYIDSMNTCLADGLDRWYLAMEEGRIIGGCGIIENDFHLRPDLTPNLCAEEDCRCRGIAGALLDFACKDMAERGVSTLYLVTDHRSFYERYGWEFLTMVKEDNGESLTRMYVKKS